MRTAARYAVLLACTAASPLHAADGGELWPKDAITPPKLGGRLQVDAAVFDNDERGDGNVSSTGTEVRRVRVDAQGQLFGFEYKVELDFADDKALTRDLYVAKTLGSGKLTIGQFKQYFTLEDRISANFTTFMERSYVAQTLAPSYLVGIGYYGAAQSGNFSYGASVYNLDSNDADAAEGIGFGGRLTFAPWHDAGRVLHIGAAALQERYGTDSNAGGKQSYKPSVRTAGHMADDSKPTLLSFDNGRNIDVGKYGVEFAAVLGPVSVQAEYAGADADDDVQEGEINGYYGYLSWFVTGDSRPYEAKNGRFGRVRPQRQIGAWELALRYDFISGQQNTVGGADVSDVEISAITAGVNWHLSPNVRAMLDYSTAETRDELAGSTVDETDAVTARLQFDF